MLSGKLVHRGWSLFLDRDGVLNERPLNDYVKDPGEFTWKVGALTGLQLLSGLFGTVVVVTNQQGIGKGLMSEEDLDEIHEKMIKEAALAGGRIDKVYFCGDLRESRSFRRKPMVGMGLQARKDFPGICFTQSVMVGDTIGDMRFGKRLRMYTVLIDDQTDIARKYPGLADLRFADLEGFARFLL
jgi:histidinol-phosphate phosphatase family protein